MRETNDNKISYNKNEKQKQSKTINTSENIS
jgi:hypothetical protein